jgi:hypothetical protein
MAWLESFFVPTFTGRPAFDVGLPAADGLIELGFGVDLQALWEGSLDHLGDGPLE